MPNIRKPLGPYSRKSALERFCRKVHIPQDDSQCWEWQGARGHYGHGMFAPQGHIQRCMPAHRWLYQYVHGVTLPSNITINHKCDHPPCVNPAHLYAGTHQDNMRDMVVRNRQCKGIRSPNAKLTREQVVSIRQSALSQRQLARLHGVNDMTIRKIREGRSYKDV